MHVGNALQVHRGRQFSTKDRDHDSIRGRCATSARGAWWYNACLTSNLNGVYYSSVTESVTGIVWRKVFGTNYSFPKAEMKIARGKNHTNITVLVRL